MTGCRPAWPQISRLRAAGLKIQHLLGRGIRALSTGEMRKIQIARALQKLPEIMILDEPFDGLDEASRRDLAKLSMA